MHNRPCVYSPSKCRCHIVVSEFDYLQVPGCLCLMGRSKLKVTVWSHLTAQTFLRKQLSTQHKTHLFQPRLDFSLWAPFPAKGWQCCPSPPIFTSDEPPHTGPQLPPPRIMSAGPKKRPKNLSTSSPCPPSRPEIPNPSPSTLRSWRVSAERCHPNCPFITKSV